MAGNIHAERDPKGRRNASQEAFSALLRGKDWADVLSEMPDKRRRVIELRSGYAFDKETRSVSLRGTAMTLKQVGEVIGLKRSRIQQLERDTCRSIPWIREQLEQRTQARVALMDYIGNGWFRTSLIFAKRNGQESELREISTRLSAIARAVADSVRE